MSELCIYCNLTHFETVTVNVIKRFQVGLLNPVNKITCFFCVHVMPTCPAKKKNPLCHHQLHQIGSAGSIMCLIVVSVMQVNNHQARRQ